MPTEVVRFGPDALKRALREADGRHTSAKPLIQRDPAFTGVTILTSGRTAAWYLKYGKVLKRLGAVGHPDTAPDGRKPDYIYTARDARDFAERVRDILKSDEKPDDYISARWRGLSHEDALGKAESEAARAEGAWTWSQLVERFLDDHIRQPEISPTTGVRPPSENTDSEVSFILRHPDLDHLKPKLARDVTKREIEAVRDKWQGENLKRRPAKFVTYVKSSMKWAKLHHSAAGLEDVAPWWLELRAKIHATKRQEAKADKIELPRTPTPKDVATALFVAEKYKVLPWRKIKLPTDEQTLALFWWVCLSAQRTHASAVVRRSLIEDRTAKEGWVEVAWLRKDVKSKRDHALAIPPEMYRRTIGRALADPKRRDSTWAFPSTRTKNRGKEGREDKPAGDTILNQMLDRLRGKDKKHGQIGPDLLAEAGCPPFTPHVMRSALATFLDGQPVPGSTASAILDHAAPVPLMRPDEQQSEVTRKHYNHAMRFELKLEGLRLWTDAVLAEYEKLVAKERTDRYSTFANTTAGRLRIIPTIPDEDRWLFNLHLPPLPGAKPPSEPLRLASLSAGNDDAPEDIG
ncbi:hypothetical protein [Microvirga calopogonii]|uniref:hypothetical protein n=1 Tax=Microvirga calopogonii TaxID=2078013 RepID=UPI000E0D5BD4|nr:hypothetical protein [Microvirga calopogonii]